MSTDPLKASLLALCADGRDAARYVRGRPDVAARIEALGLDPEALVREVEATLDVAWPAHQAAGQATTRARAAWSDAHRVAAEGYAWLGRLRRALSWVERDDPSCADAARQVRGVLRAHGPRLRGVTLDVRAVLGELRVQGPTLSGRTPLDRVLADAEPLLARLEAAGVETSEAEAARKQRVKAANTARAPLEAALRRLRRAWAWADAEAGRRFGALTFQTCAAEIGRRPARRRARAQAVAEEALAGAAAEADPIEGDAAEARPAEAPAAPGIPPAAPTPPAGAPSPSTAGPSST